MMTLTPTATDVIRNLVETSQLPETGGLRMDTSAPDMDGSQGGLAVSLVEEPDPDDVVVGEGGAHVFLAPVAATLLDDKQLDATVDEGNVTFVLLEQG